MPYNLDALGWLQFERLCDNALELAGGVDRTLWSGSADGARTVLVDEGLELPLGLGRVPGPVMVAALWVRRGPELSGLAERIAPVVAAAPRTVVLTNAPDRGADPAHRRVVFGAERLSALLDAEPRLRLRVPAVLGVRPLDDLLAEAPRAASTLDLGAAHELARVFVATRAYDRTLEVLGRHRFAVLTGPPEMGKTAIARTLGLAQLSAGWEVHECLRPEEVLARADPARPQLFIADDAFGSTEYRPDAAERWARELPRILRLTDERHWLIWTSRPAPLRAGLHRVHQERGAEHFPSPAQVQVDAGRLDTDEKASILFRHAKAAGLDADARGWVRRHGVDIVEHGHFTPERIRRLVAWRRLSGDPAPIIEAQLGTPTEAMAASLAALEEEHRALLVAMLDVPPGPVEERELAASLRRHHDGGLAHAPVDLIDRLADHFLRVLA
ncbi:MAG TPA: hypothetical protein VGJ70_10475 [Solirubrobacteraceae bacterium]